MHCVSTIINNKTMEIIDYVNLGMGLLLIVVGLLCYRYPNLINPYGGMSPERKALVDIEGLKKVVAITFVVTGFLFIVTATLSMTKVIGELTSVNVMLVLVVVMMIPLFIAMRRYNGFGRRRGNQEGVEFAENQEQKRISKKRKTKIALWTVVIMPMLCMGLFLALVLWGNKGPKYEVSSESIKVKGGGYHVTIPVADIISDSVWEHWPGIALRTNGMSTNKVNMGHFRLKNGENCMMFIHEDGGPLLELRTSDGGLYYLNCATEEETMEMIEKVKQTMDARHVTGNHDTYTLYRHGGQGSAISCTKREPLMLRRSRIESAMTTRGICLTSKTVLI